MSASSLAGGRVTLFRIILAGPLAIIAALSIMAAMPLWIPAGAAGIDGLILPIILLPLIWAALFFYACLESRLARIAVVMLVMIVLDMGAVGIKLARAETNQGPSR